MPTLTAPIALTAETPAPAESHAPPGFLRWVATLVHTHRARLVAYARRRGLDGEEALDAVQEGFVSFLRLPEARTIATDGDDALKLLTVLVRHNLQNRRRKRVRQASVRWLIESGAGEGESSEAILARAEELARVEGCILRMRRLQRDVVTLSLLDDQPSHEVARMLGITPGYVRVLLHRAREHVRTCSSEGPKS
jgi:RNA polymerase sigma-70 factor (ECF subfamily)